MKVTTPPCDWCKATTEMEVPDEGFLLYQAGELLQVAFPTLTAIERELLLTGTHGPCWDEMMGPEL